MQSEHTERGEEHAPETHAENVAADTLEVVSPEVFAPEGAEREPIYTKMPPRGRHRLGIREQGEAVRERLGGAAREVVRAWGKRALMGGVAALGIVVVAVVVREGIQRIALWRAAPVAPEVASEKTERAPSAEEEVLLLIDEHHSRAPSTVQSKTLFLTEVTKEEILRSRFEVAVASLPAGSVREVVFKSPSGAALAIGGYLANLVGEGGGAVARLLDPDATMLIYYHTDAVSTGFVAKVRPLAEEGAVEAAIIALAESPNVGNLYLVDPGEKQRVVTGSEAGGAVAQVYFSKTKHVATLEIVSRGSDRYVILGTSPNVTESLRAMAQTR